MDYENLTPQYRIEEYLEAIVDGWAEATQYPYPDYPSWRIEEFLDAFITYIWEDGDHPRHPCPEPVWHIEECLRAIYDVMTGAATPWAFPTPTNNIEEYLAAIHAYLADGTELPVPEPVWRIEQWLAYVLDGVKQGGGGGTETTVTGNLPLTLANALSNAIISLTRYGLCTQDGTPTPDAPVDIMCNSGALKWDSVNQRVYADGTPEVLTVSGKNLLNAATNTTGKYISGSGNITGGDGQYTDLIPVTVGNLYVCAFTSARDSGTNRLHGYNSNGTWVKQLSYASATGMQGKKVALSALIPSGISYIRLSYGQTDTDAIISQEPIPSNELYVGRGTYIKSLESTITSPYSFTAYDGFGFVTPVVPESTYAFTWSGTGFNTYGIGFYASIDDVTDASKRISGGDIKGLYTFVVPSGANYAVLVFANSNKATLTLDYLYVNPAPTYAPYVPPQTASVPMLLSVGDVKDEVELIHGPLTRRVTACLYDGTQSVGDVYMSTTGGKDAGAIIVYPLATPATEQITGQNLVTNEGTNIVDATAEVEPLTAEVTYKANA